MSRSIQAAKFGNLEKLRNALQHGESVDTCDEKGMSLLHFAVEGSYKDCISFLLDNKANINIRRMNDLMAPIHMAVKNEDDQTLIKLLECGANVNIQDAEGYTPLHYAASIGNDQIILFLLQFNASINVFAKNFYTPLHLATESKHRETIETLFSVGADPNSVPDVDKLRQSDVFWSPLHIAVQGKNIDIIKLILDNGANVNIENMQKATPLHISSQYEDSEITSLLIERGANINAKDKDGDSPLIIAIRSHKIENVVQLLDKDSVESTNNEGETSLQIACKFGFIDVVEKLLDFDDDLEFVNKAHEVTGNTALHEAVSIDRKDIVELLLEKGADPMIRNNKLTSNNTIAEVGCGMSPITLSTGPIRDFFHDYLNEKVKEGNGIGVKIPKEKTKKYLSTSKIPIRSPSKTHSPNRISPNASPSKLSPNASPCKTNKEFSPGKSSSKIPVLKKLSPKKRAKSENEVELEKRLAKCSGNNLEDVKDYVNIMIDDTRRKFNNRVKEFQDELNFIIDEFKM